MTGERIKKLRKEKGLTQQQQEKCSVFKNQQLQNMKTDVFQI